MKFMSRIKKGHKLTRFGLALAYAGLLVLFACPLATSTLAWFSIGSYNRISNIKFGFDPGTKLKAQLKSLSSEEWIDPDKDGCFYFSNEFSFAPVSNMFASDWYAESTYASLDPEIDKPKYMLGYGGSEVTSTTRTPYAQENNQYISLQFRFTCDRDLYLFLDSKTTVVEADKEANKATASDLSYVSESDLNRVEKACRISFFGNMGYTVYEPNKEENDLTYYGGRLNIRSGQLDGYWDYDEKTGKEILYGEYSDGALDALEYELVTSQDPIGDPMNTLEAVSKKGNLAISNLSSLKEEGLIASERSYTLQELGADAENVHPLLFIPAGQTRKLTVSIYIEGWDKDCDTFIEAATLGASITFTGVYASKGNLGTPILGEDAKTN